MGGSGSDRRLVVRIRIWIGLRRRTGPRGSEVWEASAYPFREATARAVMYVPSSAGWSRYVVPTSTPSANQEKVIPSGAGTGVVTEAVSV